MDLLDQAKEEMIVIFEAILKRCDDMIEECPNPNQTNNLDFWLPRLRGLMVRYSRLQDIIALFKGEKKKEDFDPDYIKMLNKHSKVELQKHNAY